MHLSTASTRVVRVDDGTELAVHVLEGPTGSPTIVWAHANGFCASSYEPLLSQLAKSMRVVAIDIRGHGHSTQPKPPYEDSLAMPRLGTDYEAVLHVVRQETPGVPLIGAGHSMGALLPLIAATQGQALDRLVLIDAAVLPPTGSPVRAEALALTEDRVKNIPRRRSTFTDPSELHNSLARLPAFAALPQEYLMKHCTAVLRSSVDGRHELRCPPSVEAFLYGELARFDQYNALAELRMPVLIMGADPLHPGSTWVSRTQPLLSAMVPGSDLKVLTGTGHLAPLQSPMEISEGIEQWMKS